MLCQHKNNQKSTKLKRALSFWDKALLREHYMKMKKLFIYFYTTKV
jgi:hypothetical protein